MWFARCLGSSMQIILPQRTLTVALFRGEYNLLEWHNWTLEKVLLVVAFHCWNELTELCLFSESTSLYYSWLLFPWKILCSTSQSVWSQAQFFTSFLTTIFPLNFIWQLSHFYHFQWLFPPWISNWLTPRTTCFLLCSLIKLISILSHC